MLPILLPILATLAEKGLGLLGDAVLSKGKDFIEDKLGVDLEESLKTEEGLIKLKQLELEHEEFLLKIALEQAHVNLREKELEVDNTKDARSANNTIQSNINASYLAKNAAYWLDIFVVVCTFAMAYLILFHEIPTPNKEIFYTTFGSLITLCMTVINFHRGSSARSADKDGVIEKLSRGGK